MYLSERLCGAHNTVSGSIIITVSVIHQWKASNNILKQQNSRILQLSRSLTIFVLVASTEIELIHMTCIFGVSFAVSFPTPLGGILECTVCILMYVLYILHFTLLPSIEPGL